MIKKNKDGLNYPSIDKLLEKVDSKYKLVYIASKIAHIIEDQKLELKECICQKNIGKALEEIIKDRVKVVFE
ncbi:DNA-directed RNA polymerase subunit omega [Candidatus Phytoplasma prunorum]|uniref:DNA-directed RNA polymerase subunit omega n=1 Tax=Candidatus Phytoplasma prunorum TaxID=47565 RepID=UPI002FF06B5C